MTERDFCYWLQGIFEVGRVETLDSAQVKMIRDHLALVFNKVTPPPLEGNRLNPIGQDYSKMLGGCIGMTPPHAISIC